MGIEQTRKSVRPPGQTEVLCDCGKCGGAFIHEKGLIVGFTRHPETKPSEE